MKGVQCYEIFGGIALKNHAFSFFSFSSPRRIKCRIFIKIFGYEVSTEFFDYLFIYIYFFPDFLLF